ncbi:hypothetical protein [Xanthomarina gelatinilytica]|uniref:hypothetical protein n=1 Tax=Xanthomarina gelatinilytica TaxID=1137281 RepID=UPI003AA9D05C
MKKAIFWISITLNFILIVGILWNKFNSPSNELGVLKQDIEVGYFMGNETVFILPKGLTVKNKSERGIAAIGQFENNRFSIVITSDKDIVEYDVDKKELNQNGNFYSAEFKTFLNNEETE